MKYKDFKNLSFDIGLDFEFHSKVVNRFTKNNYFPHF